jgi:hypothetical protein
MSAKIRYIAACAKHGTMSKDWEGRMVVVPKPQNSVQRKEGGCHFCAAERRRSAEEPKN